MGEQPMRADFQNVRCLGIVGLLAGMVVSTSAAAGPAVPADEPDAAVIVAEGVAQAAIVVAEDASEAVLRAAEELRRCIEQMTTVALPLADDASVQHLVDAQPQPCLGIVDAVRRLHGRGGQRGEESQDKEEQHAHGDPTIGPATAALPSRTGPPITQTAVLRRAPRAGAAVPRARSARS